MKQALWIDGMIGVICVSLALLAMGLHWHSPVARALQSGQRINGLVIGSDYEDNSRHSDTLMVVSYDPQTRFLDVLSIPRDTRVSIPGLPHVRRINETFAYEFRHSGRNFVSASLGVKSVVESLLSTGTAQAFEIPYFLTVDYDGFRALIDALGGIYVKVSEPMHYDDNWGHLHIHFDPGAYLMNGRSALQYVRFRGASADQGRVLRQQLFIKQMLKRFANPLVLWRLPQYSHLLLSGVHTNFSLWDLAILALEGRRLKSHNLRLFSLPGRPEGNLWEMNPENTKRLVNLLRVPAPRGGPSSAESTGGLWMEPSSPPLVEVFNASDHPRAAYSVMRLLRKKGFDVVRMGKYSTRLQRTLVLDRSGRLRPAQAVAAVLPGGNPEVVSRIDPALQVDVSVILGNDYVVPHVAGKRRFR